jgi:hypothetical protein
MGSHLRHHHKHGVPDYDALILLNHEWETLCEWIISWTDFELWGYCRHEPPLITITSDASCYGWAAHTFPLTWESRGHFDALERMDHHNIQENLAGNRGTVAYAEQVGLCGSISEHFGVRIPVCIKREQDNKAVIKVNDALMCKSTRLCETTNAHQDYLDYRGLQEVMGFISGKTMDTERQADTGSRKRSTWPR